MIEEKAALANKQKLISVMQEESALLDTILEQQSVLHLCVTERRWDELETTTANLQALSDTFTELEQKRVALAARISVGSEDDLAPVLRQVRSKLLKSRVENNALNEYIRMTRRFLQGVFDSVVPQRRNTLYSRTGEIVKPELSSLVLNQVI